MINEKVVTFKIPEADPVLAKFIAEDLLVKAKDSKKNVEAYFRNRASSFAGNFALNYLEQTIIDIEEFINELD